MLNWCAVKFKILPYVWKCKFYSDCLGRETVLFKTFHLIAAEVGMTELDDILDILVKEL
jgi:N-acyl-D-aspartate/D-glutamate deacylase